MNALSGTSRPRGGPDIDILERIGTLLELLSHLHHDMVLVNSLIHGGDLPLAKGVVQRVIDYLRRQAQARGRIAVDDQAGFQCAVLQIAIHILKLRDRSQLLLHQGRPSEQVLQVVTLQCVLELRVAATPADLHVLLRRHEKRCSRNASQLGPQAIHDLEHAGLALG